MQAPIKTLVTMFILLIFISSFVTLSSCNNEELFIEPISDVILETEQPVEETNAPAEDTNSETIDATAPCEFTLDDVQDGDTIIINCVMDLGGNTINLPANVTIVYDGGKIINGTLNFSDNTIISGELLNPSLTLGGSTPQLKDTTFNFDPQRWGIVEGVVSDATALTNTSIINAVIKFVITAGVDTFIIPTMNAFFDANNSGTQTFSETVLSTQGIIIPSNITINMASDTFIRVQPNNKIAYTLLTIYDVDNVTITGGNLVGDKYEHDYSYQSSFGTHEWGFLVNIVGSHNIIIDGVTMDDATGDAVYTANKFIRNTDGSITGNNRTAEHIYIKNCTIRGSRRNNLSPVDGNWIYIDNNDILNAGEGTGSGFGWWGVSPRSGIDLEAYRERDGAGNLLEYQRIENVIISNNRFAGSANADLVLYTTNDVEVFGNSFTKGIGNTAAFNISIHDNYFKSSEFGKHIAINARQWVNTLKNELLNYNWEIYNNTIEGYNYGIWVSIKDTEIHHNTYTDCGFISLSIKDLAENLYIHDEIINSSEPNSFGLKNYLVASSSTNINLERIKINVKQNAFELQNFTGLGTGLTVKDCDFNGGTDVKITNSSNVTIENSTFTTVSQSGNTNVAIP